MNQEKEPAFLADFMIGSLAKWLRIFGYDVKYAKKKNDIAGLVLDSLKESRVLLTRNQSLSRNA